MMAPLLAEVYGTHLAGVYGPIWMSVPVLALACGPPAWLGSDLLSLRFTGNPEPLREWRPAEFLARFVGRLAPVLGVLLATGAAFSLGGLGDVTLQGKSPPLFWYWSNWAGVSLPFLASALCYAAVASLVSSLAKRPRRWLISPLVVIFGSGLATGFGEWKRFLRLGPGETEYLLFLVGTPNLQVGYFWGVLLRDLASDRLGLDLDIFLAAAILFLTVAILAGLWTWGIAARRYRRSRAVQSDE